MVRVRQKNVMILVRCVWYAKHVWQQLIDCKQKMMIFEVAWCEDGVIGDIFVYREVWGCTIGAEGMYENSRKLFNDRLGSKICITKQMGMMGDQK